MSPYLSVDDLEALAYKHHVGVEADYTARRLVLELPWGTFYAPLPEDVQEVTC